METITRIMDPPHLKKCAKTYNVFETVADNYNVLPHPCWIDANKEAEVFVCLYKKQNHNQSHQLLINVDAVTMTTN